MLNTLKAFVAVSIGPVLIVTLFHVNVIKSAEASRSPAVEKEKSNGKSLRERLATYSPMTAR